MSTVADFTLVADSPPMTVEEFLALPENGVHRELIQGRVREMGMTVRNRFHSRIEARIVQRLLNWLDQQPQPRGEVVCGEAGFRLKGTKESLVGIDVALVSHELMPGQRQKRQCTMAHRSWPSRSSRPATSMKTPSTQWPTYLEVGTVVWVVDPDFQTVTVFQPGDRPRALNIEDELRADAYLPGFRVRVADLLG